MQSFLKKKIYLSSHSTWSVWVETNGIFVRNRRGTVTLYLECVSWNEIPFLSDSIQPVTLHLECVSWNISQIVELYDEHGHTPLGVRELKWNRYVQSDQAQPSHTL